MNRVDKLSVAVVGLRFGGMFLNAFAAHPDVGRLGLCDTDEAQLRRAGARLPDAALHRSLDEVLAAEPGYDAVALFTPIPLHAQQTLQVLAAKRHCACAVPMATKIEELQAIIAARRAADRVYMMMETAWYWPETLWAVEAMDAGDFGRLQLLRGGFQINVENHERYWHGLPPMHYVTHPIAPLLRLAGTCAASVCCHGSGTMRDEFQAVYHQPYPAEVALFRLHDSPAVMEITSMMFEAAFPAMEWFDAIGSKRSFFWKRFAEDEHGLVQMHPYVSGGTRSVPSTNYRFTPSPRLDLMPEPLRHLGGLSSAAHLVHHFVVAARANQESPIDAVISANITAPGLCAHESAMRGGVAVEVPTFG